ncbi:MAG: DUF6599 family protein [Candidatus Eisenbacteria bacterium]
MRKTRRLGRQAGPWRGGLLRRLAAAAHVAAGMKAIMAAIMAAIMVAIVAVIAAAALLPLPSRAAPPEEMPSPSAPGSRAFAPRRPAVVVPPVAADGAWMLDDSASATYDARTIYDYMDGAGEIYTGYRFDHLDVRQYQAAPEGEAAGEGPIVVELYWMGSSDDAFGLLSLDWRGERISLLAPSGDPADSSSFPHALLDRATLRFWSADLYGKIAAWRDTGSSRAAVLEIARGIVGRRNVVAPPQRVREFAAALRRSAADCEADSIVFARSWPALRALPVFASAGDNLLQLDPESSQLLLAPCGGSSDRAETVLWIEYGGGEEAARAGEKVRLALFPLEPEAVEGIDVFVIGHDEAGRWSGGSRSGAELLLVLYAADREALLHRLASIAGAMPIR